MKSSDFFARSDRFIGGDISAWDYATWILQHADEMEPLLNEAVWALYLSVESAAAEFTSGEISVETFLSTITNLLAPAPVASHR